jgi:hypothetical protein
MTTHTLTVQVKQPKSVLVLSGLAIAVAALVSLVVAQQTGIHRPVVVTGNSTDLVAGAGPQVLSPTDAARRAALERSIRAAVSPGGQYRRIDSIAIKRTTLATFVLSGGAGFDLTTAQRLPAWTNTQQSVYVVLTTGLFYLDGGLPSGTAPTPSSWDVQVWNTPLNFEFSEDANNPTTPGIPAFFRSIPDTTGS